MQVSRMLSGCLARRCHCGILTPLACKAPGSAFEPLGLDVVCKSVADFFECSPLSCNGAAKTFKANSHCLFDALDDAVAAAKEFSKRNWEPGPYYVARVLRQRAGED
jgi:hypothetical protein